MLRHADTSITFSKYIHYGKKEEKKRGQFLNQELSSIRLETTQSEKLIA